MKKMQVLKFFARLVVLSVVVLPLAVLTSCRNPSSPGGPDGEIADVSRRLIEVGTPGFCGIKNEGTKVPFFCCVFP
jgi:hypothetical protein